MTYRHGDIIGWMNPWPIRFSRRFPWRIRFVSVRQALRYKSFWHTEQGKRVTAMTAAKLIRKNWLNKDHQIASAARVGRCLHRPVILVHAGVIVDGNHTLLALERRRYRGRIMVIEADAA